ncbi:MULTISPECIES: hypothetical protein [unclassified Rhizobium]|uniref:hypothetical protein n=1 Tax=unclassified Rhizobium TaxID=2613769 RepID=UPI000713AD4D|nr:MULTISPECIES: hypothetical protein [unclassified Rhizobium]KQS83899.1 hypothetical protein ASG50_11325 [Rhizobium sp. Leaf386]KQS95725.1 hypothetical protein ASG42_29210 [Rhizobium sp. Leaf391]KQU08839.1 hypothetical protein ASG68_21970 [Rhizobium sp. Leaf453]
MRRIGVVLAAYVITQPLFAQEAGVIDDAIENPVDFGRVANDMAEATSNGFRETLQFPGADQLGDFTPAVPVLIPQKLFVDLKAGTTELGGDQVGLEDTTRKAGISFSKSGYSAWVSYPKFNMNIQASSISYAAANDASPAFAGAKPDYYNKLAGDVITFGYAGADYMVLFECLVGDEECVTEGEADKIVDKFVLCDQQGGCVGTFPVNTETQP